MVFLIAFAAAVGFAAGVSTLRSGDIESAGGRTISLELEGKKKETTYDSDYTLSCADGKYAKRTLKLAYELPFASLFRDHKGVAAVRSAGCKDRAHLARRIVRSQL